MKIKEGYVLRQVASHWVVLPVGSSCADFNGMLSLNDSGVILFRALETGCDRDALADALTAEYDVEREQALADVDEFLDVLVKAGCIEE